MTSKAFISLVVVLLLGVIPAQASAFSVNFEGGGERYLFTGKELDKDTGLYYYGARYYKSVFATFTQPDPIVSDPYDPQILNRYAYTRRNPLKYTDPTGNYIDTAIDVASLAISIRDVRQDPANKWNWVALAADVVTFALPVVAGGGMAVKALTKGDDVVDAGKFVAKYGDEVVQYGDEALDVAKGADNAVKKVTNKWGKKGSPAHQEAIKKGVKRYTDEGYKLMDTETKINIGEGGYKATRYGDALVKHPDTGHEVVIQAGKINKRGDPVIRERRALQDIERARKDWWFEAFETN